MNFQTINPATGQTLNSYSYMSTKEVLECIELRSQQQHQWAQLTIAERTERLSLVIKNLEKLKESFLTLIHNEMGKSLAEARAEFEKSMTLFPYFFEAAPRVLATKEVSSKYSHSEVRLEPLGLILGIMPWNFPLWQVMRFAVPSLLAGNLIILKHSDITAGTALLIEKAFKIDGFDLITNCHFDHSSTEQVVASPKIRAVTFTGSTQAGRVIAQLAGKYLKKSVLELGGMDAYLVLADANLDLAAEALVRGRFLNCGQSCVAVKRIFVERAVVAQFVSLFREKAEKFPLSSLAAKRFQAKVHSQVQELVAAGAKLICGGILPEGPGAFYPATVLLFEKPQMSFADQEVFGPVILISAIENWEQGVEAANSSLYGLGGGVFTSSQDIARKVLSQLQAGFVVHNDFVKSEAGLPFGGCKDSGYGRELGEDSLREFVHIKTVAHR